MPSSQVYGGFSRIVQFDPIGIISIHIGFDAAVQRHEFRDDHLLRDSGIQRVGEEGNVGEYKDFLKKSIHGRFGI